MASEASKRMAMFAKIKPVTETAWTAQLSRRMRCELVFSGTTPITVQHLERLKCWIELMGEAVKDDGAGDEALAASSCAAAVVAASETGNHGGLDISGAMQQSPKEETV